MHERPQGPRVVTRTIRPPRVAYILGGTSDCEKFIEICSLTWGGKYFCPIPYDPGAGITEEWWRLLQLYDPDKVLSCVDLDEATQERLIEMTISRSLPAEKRQERRTPTRPLVPNAAAIQGQSVYSALAGAGAHERVENLRPLLVPNVPADHPLRLYIDARFGALNETWSSEILTRAYLRPDLGFGSFVPLQKLGVGDALVRFIRRTEKLMGKWRPRSLIDYSLLGLGSRGPTTHIGDPSSGYIKTPYILIVSGEDPVEDFCWFWNLRVQRVWPQDAVLPLWLPLTVAELERDELAGLFHPKEKGYLLSKSLPAEELQSLAAELGSLEVVTEDLCRFYAGDFSIGDEEQEEVFVQEGRLRTSRPTSDYTQYAIHQQFHLMDVELPDYQLPRLNVGNWGGSRLEFVEARYRVSRTGLTFSSMSYRDRYIEFTIPSPWQMLQTFAEIAGFKTSLSDKGAIGQSLVELVGGLEYCWLLSGRSVYEVSDKLAEIRQAKEFKSRLKEAGQTLAEEDRIDVLEQIMRAIAADHHERAFVTFGEIKNALGFKDRKAAQAVVEWLLQRNLVFRGLVIKCPLCNTKQWQTLDDLRSRMQCVGCQQAVETPVGVDSAQWRYRANPFFARAYEQGVIPHLLTLSYFVNPVGRSAWESNGVVASFAGVKLEALEGRDTPFQEIEIDVAWIEDGYLTIGECKTNGRELSVAEIEKYLRLSELMKCKRIVFSALDGFEDLSPDGQKLVEDERVVLLDGDELYDQFPGRASARRHMGEEDLVPARAFEANLRKRLEALLGSEYGYNS